MVEIQRREAQRVAPPTLRRGHQITRRNSLPRGSVCRNGLFIPKNGNSRGSRAQSRAFAAPGLFRGLSKIPHLTLSRLPYVDMTLIRGSGVLGEGNPMISTTTRRIAETPPCLPRISRPTRPSYPRQPHGHGRTPPPRQTLLVLLSCDRPYR